MNTQSPRKSQATQEQAVLQLLSRHGLLHTRDIAALGVPTVVLTRLTRAGKLERTGRGVYTLAGEQGSAQRSLAEVALRAPRAVICLLSALNVHEVGTQLPFQVWLALPPGTTPPRMDHPLRIVRMSGGSLSDGVERIRIDGVDVPVFNTAKTIADCFKFRNKVGMDVALEALREGWRARRFTMTDLEHYAGICRVQRVMLPYLEAMVA